ncbi:MAG TPA: sigma 54-interacting transcriptional regulator, partial [Humisphaera sp.]|nr:sigma 54-interacting transcriptional regulator [Humisphaera sp.]
YISCTIERVLFSPSQQLMAKAFSRLLYCNPFLPERVDCERAILGGDFDQDDAAWDSSHDLSGDRPNVLQLQALAESTAAAARQRLMNGAHSSDREMELYEDLVIHLLYYRCQESLHDPIVRTIGRTKQARKKMPAYAALAADLRHFLEIPGRDRPMPYEPAHLFALFYQVRRAFHHIFASLAGRSAAIVSLRAAIWQSIFTHDIARYRRSLYKRMGDFTTLITGPSGAGKELVARAIALSRYIPFDPVSQTFVEDFAGSFQALSLSALSPTLIESELFGHRRGAFTGALGDRAGWLETCPDHGAVFLDEVGEIDPLIQVKLLRVLQTRVFQRLGDTEPQLFRGKILAATNRNLAVEMESGRFRRDFYYRLCSDMIQTPSLADQLRQTPDELKDLILFIARREAGDEAESLADEVMAWVEKSLGHDYAWPGNFRELEQCVRNVLLRREYHPAVLPAKDADDEFSKRMLAGSLTADELLRGYCTLVYKRCGSYEETARRVKLDRRTVKDKVDRA